MKKMIFLKVKNSYNKKLVTWLDLNLQVALKNRVYNKTFKNYICIFKQIKNINFSINIKYENIYFSTVIIDKNINNSTFAHKT